MPESTASTVLVTYRPREGEVESLDRSCALDGQLFTDALFIF